ncbi:MAG TPA: YbaL family putative K(+) efflux transporter [Moraxellaceae bacterium]|nr:YbaL family putative K(+) efflux transporter [Moraxellaceae bacterium]
MPHDIRLITTLAAGFGLALVLGLLVARLRLPPLVGYLLAGIALSPATPGLTADLTLAQQLAEIGVMLMMFGVGLHFSLQDLWSVRHIAVPGAIAQIAVATLLGAGLTTLWGWSPGAGLVFGLALSVASTVVLLKALEQQGILQSVNGRIAVGWLVVEDLVTVLALVLLPALAGPLGGKAAAGSTSLPVALALTVGKVAAFVALMLLLGRRLFPWLLWQVARAGSRELFTLAIIAAALGVAYGATALFGVSFALGAFFAGMVMRESPLSHRAAEDSLPLKDAFAVLFFVSVGMLFDPAILVEQPLRVLAVTLVIMIGKSLAAFVIVLLFRYPVGTALTVSASLAQIGEFSFILAGLGLALGLLPREGQNLLLAGAILSISLNPLLFRLLEPAQAWLRRHSELLRRLERSNDPLATLPIDVDAELLTGHVTLVGYGRVGRRIGEALRRHGINFVVAEQNREVVEELRREGVHAVAGEGADPAVLIQAHIARAAIFVIATPDAFKARQMIEIARMLNPGVRILVRTHSEAEAELLEKEAVAGVFLGEHELAHTMTRRVLATLRKDAEEEEAASP